MARIVVSYEGSPEPEQTPCRAATEAEDHPAVALIAKAEGARCLPARRCRWIAGLVLVSVSLHGVARSCRVVVVRPHPS